MSQPIFIHLFPIINKYHISNSKNQFKLLILPSHSPHWQNMAPPPSEFLSMGRYPWQWPTKPTCLSEEWQILLQVSCGGI